MPIEKFTRLVSSAVPLPAENVDTDQILPARFLKAVTREGFGEYLFRDLRFDSAGNPLPDFPLNRPEYAGRILVAGRNFGSGSSREHAAWALVDYGFRAVISSFFADIFRNNALNNGLLPVQVSEQYLNVIFLAIDRDPKVRITIDLEKQKVMLGEDIYWFEINPFRKQCLLNGWDDVDYLLGLQNEIRKYEENSNT
ncbi:MAG TPA: 3-isopropylmalate dehydratase small subunit [Bacteroidetes bacterium]|nr:3-isopropylmalate dehydratase small subunit [Bacteroidota bacterium]